MSQHFSDATIDHVFKYHPPTPGQQESYEAIRAAGRDLARVIRDRTPQSADQTEAIRRVREAVMFASAAIACGVIPEAE